MRAIDADALVKELTRPTGLYADCERCSWSISNECMDCIVEDVIKHMPTIDPIKHGYWIYTGEWNLPECSICGKVSHSALYGDEDAYCPCCGAEMGGAE